MHFVTLKPHNSFKNQKYRKASHTFVPRLLFYKLQQECLKFNDFCGSWSSPKNDLQDCFTVFLTKCLEKVVVFLRVSFLHKLIYCTIILQLKAFY